MPFTIPMHLLTSAALSLAVVSAPLAAQWTPLPSGTNVSLRGLSVVDGRTVWASGEKGTVLHSTDGGASWRVDSVPGARALDFRSVHARSRQVAHVAATAGRIYRTTDGGATWSLRYQASDSSLFLDAIDFWDDQHGMALGDPKNGRFFLLITQDGGDTWHEPPIDERPVAEPGEAAFAASGTSLVLHGDAAEMGAWIVTGGAVARVHRSMQRGRSWVATATPMRQGGGSEGIFSIAAVPGEGWFLVGGHYSQNDSTRGNAAFSVDGGQWRAMTTGSPLGYRSGVAFARIGGAPPIGIAVGPGGSDISRDGGRHWVRFDAAGYHAVRASRDGIFYASGSGGRLARFEARARP